MAGSRTSEVMRFTHHSGEELEQEGHGSYHSPAKILPTVAGMSPSIDLLPSVWHPAVMITDVAVLVYDGVAPFELGVLHETWGTDRSDDGLPPPCVTARPRCG